MSTASIRSSHATLAGLRPHSRSAWRARLTEAFDLLLTWYERARQLGASGAEERLRRLGAAN